MKTAIGLFVVILLAPIFVMCSGDGIPELIILDFESDSDLDRVSWKCHTLLNLAEKHATNGKNSLRLELYPSKYPGFVPILEEKDWRAYNALCLDIYNPSNKNLKIVIRIDDRKDFPHYDNRYNMGFELNPGKNNIRIPLDTLITSRTKRKLELKTIHRLLIFMVHPLQKVVLYLDYIRLVS
jgi:hypothetical protein